MVFHFVIGDNGTCTMVFHFIIYCNGICIMVFHFIIDGNGTCAVVFHLIIGDHKGTRTKAFHLVICLDGRGPCIAFSHLR